VKLGVHFQILSSFIAICSEEGTAEEEEDNNRTVLGT